MSNIDLDALLAVCRDYDGNDLSESLREAMANFIREAADDVSLLAMASESLTGLPPLGASFFAVAIGAVVEDKGRPEFSTAGVWDLFISLLSRLPASNDEIEANADPDIIIALSKVSRSVVSHLSGMPDQVAELVKDQDLLNRLDVLEPFSDGVLWVRQLLLQSSGSLIVIHPPSAKGVKVKYNNIGQCFQLFSMLQIAIGQRLPGGRLPEPEVTAAVHGSSPHEVHDTAWWHYGDPRCATPSLSSSIWGEALVSSIPQINGEQVLLLWPRILQSRGWTSGFFGARIERALPSVIIEHELTSQQVQTWMDKLGITVSKPLKWWQRLRNRGSQE